MEKQIRRDLDRDQHVNKPSRLHAHHFFYHHERLCQYLPLEQTDMVNDLKRMMTQLMWPRLVAVRVNVLLHALMPLLNLTADGTFGVMLDGVSSILSPLGWVLHGLRLLINALWLLQEAIANSNQTHHGLVTIYPTRGIECMNDLIWILGAVASSTLAFTLAFFVVDIIWLLGRTIFHYGSSHEPAIENRKFLIHLINIVSIHALSIMKHFVLPTYWPVLATNPILLVVFAGLSLGVTIGCHVIEMQLQRIKKGNANEPEYRLKLADTPTRLTFFQERSHASKLNKSCMVSELQAIM